MVPLGDAMISDPDGQSDPGGCNFYGLKARFLQEIKEMRERLDKLEKLVHRQDEILNDTTRIAVYRELLEDLRKESGNLGYENAYTGAHEEAIRRVDGLINYLSKYGWGAGRVK